MFIGFCLVFAISCYTCVYQLLTSCYQLLTNCLLIATICLPIAYQLLTFAYQLLTICLPVFSQFFHQGYSFSQGFQFFHRVSQGLTYSFFSFLFTQVDAVCALAVAPHADSQNDRPDLAVRMAEQEEEARTVLRSRLNHPDVSRVLEVIHSEPPLHYTVLERSQGPDKQWVLRYFDSMKGFSVSGRSKAQVFADQCGWDLVVPEPVNQRFQSDKWSCGLWSLQWVEESVRRHRGEPLVVPVVAVSDILGRVNSFIQKVVAQRPVPEPAAQPPAVPSQTQFAAVVSGLDTIIEAKSQSLPVPTASIVSVDLPHPPVPPPCPAPPVRPKQSAISKDSFAAALAAVCANLDSGLVPASAAGSASAAPPPPLPVGSAAAPASAAATASAADPASAVPAPPPPVGSAAVPASSEYTQEMAFAAQSRCSKCRRKGCAVCLKQWHVPRKLLRQWSRESAGSAGSAGQ